MHFWIDKRDTQLHYGRRRPPGVFYSRRLSGQKFAACNPPTSSSSAQQQQQTYGSSSSASASTSNTTAGIPYHNINNHNQNHHSSSSSNSRSNNCMVTPVHRFTPIESTCRLNLANTAGNTSPSSRSSRNSNQLSGRSRSRSRSRSRDRGRRSSSSLRGTPTYSGDAAGGIGTPIPDYGQQLTTSSLSSSEISDPKWDRTKKTVGLTLCFLAFIILMLVTAKFVIEGPSLIDTSRRGQSEATTYFFIMELVFVLFAMTLFFTGVACLRKRTNEYLLRHFNQHILQSNGGVPQLISHHPLNTSGYGLNNNNSGSDYFEHSSTHEDDENQENYFLQQQTTVGNSSGLGYHQQVHHHLLHPVPGISPTSSLPTCLFRNQMTSNNNSNSSNGHRNYSNTHIIAMGPDGSRFAFGNSHPSSSSSSSGRHSHERRHHLHQHHHMNMNIHSQQQQPPPYHIALYLPLPSQNYDGSVKPSIEMSSDVLMKSNLASDIEYDNDELVVVSTTSQSQAGKDNHDANITSTTSNTNTNSNNSTGNSVSGAGENNGAGGISSSGTNLTYNSQPAQQQQQQDQVVVRPETPPPSYEEFNLKKFQNI